MAQLLVRGPDGATSRFPLNRKLRIGRQHADILLEDPAVSRQHATLEPSFVLRDLGGINGVYVHGKRLEPKGRTVLRLGDQVQIGAKGTFVLSIVEDVEDAATLSDGALATMEEATSPDDTDEVTQLRAELAKRTRECEELRQQLDHITESNRTHSPILDGTKWLEALTPELLEMPEDDRGHPVPMEALSTAWSGLCRLADKVDALVQSTVAPLPGLPAARDLIDVLRAFLRAPTDERRDELHRHLRVLARVAGQTAGDWYVDGAQRWAESYLAADADQRPDNADAMVDALQATVRRTLSRQLSQARRPA